MRREYLGMDVYAAFRARMRFIFEEFENIYVSFSGGKDSGLLLNMVLDFQQQYYPDRRIGVYHQDFEAQYTVTTEYVERTFQRIAGQVEPYWVCLPMATRTALSNYEMFWYPWDPDKEEVWVRPMPRHPYVIHLDNNPITTYRYKMHQEDLARQFGRWYRKAHGGGRTLCLLGMRAVESMQRYSGFIHASNGYKGRRWITPTFKDVWCASPLYDWNHSDVWHANYLFGYDYNRLYDLYYMAGLHISQMRVASPFNDYSKDSLNLYRVIDPEIWVRLVGRVQGANFTAIYGRTKAMGYRNVTLPPGHTWESYTRFLLDTLPEQLRQSYEKKFATSMAFWHTTGGGLDAETIAELQAHGYQIRLNGVSNYTRGRKTRVIFEGPIPDDTDDIRSTRDVPSWKRMCYCILKNDHMCRTMGFGLTREQQRQVEAIRRKYGRIEENIHGEAESGLSGACGAAGENSAQ